MLNASVGVQRVLMRLRPDPDTTADPTDATTASSAATAGRSGVPIHATPRRPRRSTSTTSIARHAVARIASAAPTPGPWRTAPASGTPGARSRSQLARHRAAGRSVRERFLGVGRRDPRPRRGGGRELRRLGEHGPGGTGGTSRRAAPAAALDQPLSRSRGLDDVDDGAASAASTRPARPIRGPAGRRPGDELAGPFLDDGTLLMPVAVDTTVADGSALLRSYQVKSGDTLTGIAHQLRRLHDERLVGEPAHAQGRAPRRPDPGDPAGQRRRGHGRHPATRSNRSPRSTRPRATRS